MSVADSKIDKNLECDKGGILKYGKTKDYSLNSTGEVTMLKNKKLGSYSTPLPKNSSLFRI